MYDEDAAVAKLDGYVISVAGAGRLIGEKRLVRIERVGRSSASASLVDDGGQPTAIAAAAATNARVSAEDEGAKPDTEEKPKRRRGSRGGRGRKKAVEPAE